MNSDSYIFDIVRQKVKIFSSKFIIGNFLATHQRKQFFASSLQAINFTSIAINTRRTAKAYSVLVDTFRRQATSASRRAMSTIRRAIPTMCRALLAMRRADSTMRRVDLAIRRADLAMWRADSTTWRGTLAIQYIELKH